MTRTKPMREDELREVDTCAVCNEKIGASGILLFWRVRLTRHGLDRNAINRQEGLTMLLHGQPALARIMGPDEEMTKVLSDVEITVCEPCAGKPTTVYGLGLSDGDDDTDDEYDEDDKGDDSVDDYAEGEGVDQNEPIATTQETNP